MLKLTDITKDYIMPHGDTIHALAGVSLNFRKNEFVSILGPSGCGKTTMLNIIGGLDRYTSGDLTINRVSTKKYKDKDWDAYRNRSIGFVFQNYNLIPHLSVIGNVELAMTLAGVSMAERRERAEAVLDRVGLKREIHKRPNQLSGGQMQRVAIARALVNNPEILLADEPTGALDSKTSVQIMEILKEVAKERLVIMVTHNGDLAERYSTRIVRLHDGLVIGDTNPYDGKEEIEITIDVTHNVKKAKKTSMSLWTAIKLSGRNLLSKKGRTILTSIAGSIGIIGIALILAMSTGFQAYIDKMQSDTMSTYPLTINRNFFDVGSMQGGMGGTTSGGSRVQLPEFPVDSEIVNIRQKQRNPFDASNAHHNNITESYVNNVIEPIKTNFNVIDILYERGTLFNVYSKNKNSNTMYSAVKTETGPDGGSIVANIAGAISSPEWGQLVDLEFLDTQYDILKGKMPSNPTELVIVVDKYNRIQYETLVGLGIIEEGDEIRAEGYTFNDFIGLEFKLISNDNMYSFIGGRFVTNTSDYKIGSDISETVLNADGNIDLKIVGILRANPDTSTGAITSKIGYLPALVDVVLGLDDSFDGNGTGGVGTGFGSTSEVGRWMEANPDNNPLTNLAWGGTPAQSEATKLQVSQAMAVSTMITTIKILPVSYQDKEDIKAYLDTKNIELFGSDENNHIKYSDVMAVMMGAVKTAIDAISYILIAFTSVALVVSSIMIGIITYVSVIERTKEIGILRSVGARKKDIRRVFNAETMIIGFCAGMFGVLVTYLLTIPINMILNHYVPGIGAVAQLNPLHALVLITISIGLTLISGLMPSSAAAKKDPVVALRTE